MSSWRKFTFAIPSLDEFLFLLEAVSVFIDLDKAPERDGRTDSRLAVTASVVKTYGLLVQRRATKMLDGFENLTYKVILQQLKLTFLEKQETASWSHRHNNCQARKRSTWTVSSHWTRIFTAQEVTLTDWKSIERSRLELIKNFFSQQVVPHCQKPLSRLRQLTASTSRIGFDRCVEQAFRLQNFLLPQHII